MPDPVILLHKAQSAADAKKPAGKAPAKDKAVTPAKGDAAEDEKADKGKPGEGKPAAYRHGDWVRFHHGEKGNEVEGEGEIVGSGQDGVRIQSADGREHKVRHGCLRGKCQRPVGVPKATAARKPQKAGGGAPMAKADGPLVVFRGPFAEAPAPEGAGAPVLVFDADTFAKAHVRTYTYTYNGKVITVQEHETKRHAAAGHQPALHAFISHAAKYLSKKDAATWQGISGHLSAGTASAQHLADAHGLVAAIDAMRTKKGQAPVAASPPGSGGLVSSRPAPAAATPAAPAPASASVAPASGASAAALAKQRAMTLPMIATLTGNPALAQTILNGAPANSATGQLVQAAMAGDLAGVQAVTTGGPMLTALQNAIVSYMTTVAPGPAAPAAAPAASKPAPAATPKPATPAQPAAPASAPAASSASTKLVLANMTQTGPQGGSNPGGVFKDAATGTEYYVKKTQSDTHTDNEILATTLYKAAGHGALDMERIDIGGGRHGTAAALVAKSSLSASNPSDAALMRKAFGVHAWLANWDGPLNDNMAVVGGKVTTMDVGGSLLFRAQGGPKGAAWNDDVDEFKTLRDPSGPNPTAAAVYGHMTNQEMHDAVVDVARVSDATIQQLVQQHGPGSAADKKALADRLIARRDKLVALTEAHIGHKLNLGGGTSAAPAPAPVAAPSPAPAASAPAPAATPSAPAAPAPAPAATPPARPVVGMTTSSLMSVLGTPVYSTLANATPGSAYQQLLAAARSGNLATAQGLVFGSAVGQTAQAQIVTHLQHRQNIANGASAAATPAPPPAPPPAPAPAAPQAQALSMAQITAASPNSAVTATLARHAAGTGNPQSPYGQMVAAAQAGNLAAVQAVVPGSQNATDLQTNLVAAMTGAPLPHTPPPAPAPAPVAPVAPPAPAVPVTPAAAPVAGPVPANMMLPRPTIGAAGNNQAQLHVNRIWSLAQTQGVAAAAAYQITGNNAQARQAVQAQNALLAHLGWTGAPARLNGRAVPPAAAATASPAATPAAPAAPASSTADAWVQAIKVQNGKISIPSHPQLEADLNAIAAGQMPAGFKEANPGGYHSPIIDTATGLSVAPSLKNFVQHRIAEALGFNSLPQVQPKAQVDALIQADPQNEAFRAVGKGGPHDGKALIEQLRSKVAFFGNGVYGNGTYAARVGNHQARYAQQDSEGYANGIPPGAQARLYLPMSQMNVIKINDLRDAKNGPTTQGYYVGRGRSRRYVPGGTRTLTPEKQKIWDTYSHVQKLARSIGGMHSANSHQIVAAFHDDATIAMLAGHDMILIPSGGSSDYVNILNRAKIVVQQENHKE